MKPKLKNGITFAQTVDVNACVNTILNILEFTTALYEEEGFENGMAYHEANKLIFSRHFYALGGLTIAQWVANGGAEKKALEVSKETITEAVKESNKEEEQKIIMAKVFTKK